MPGQKAASTDRRDIIFKKYRHVGFIGRFFRNRRLKKYSCDSRTGFIPLSSAKSAVVIIDAEDSSYSECRKAAEDFFRRYGISVRFLYSDFRKFNKTTRPVSDAADTITRKDIRIFGLPRMKKVRPMIAEGTDILISLSTDTGFVTEFLVKSIKARFRIGRTLFPGEPFDLMIVPEQKESEATDGKEGNAPEPHVPQTDVFNTIADFLPKIK